MDLKPADLALLKQIAEAPNLVANLDDGKRAELATKVIEGFDLDLASMSAWIERMDTALDLAMMVKADKTTPWPSAANIRYPLVTSAALQYNARAYPAIVPSSDVVKAAIQGADKDGAKAARARRVASFMTWQLTIDSREWERGTDHLTLQLPILGDLFRKVWWDVSTNRVRCSIRLPGRHIVVNNNAQTLPDAPRVSDRLTYYPYQVRERFRTGYFAEFDMVVSGQDTQEPQEFIEQLCRCDLDGDGYEEPYVVTVHRETQTVVRVVAGFDLEGVRLEGESVVAVNPLTYLIHYQFMPAMDGGFFGTGLGLLLGDISETINTTLNMIVDSAHLASLGGGFIGAQNFRLKGGVKPVQPGEYRMVNFTGNDIRAGIVDLKFPGPSPILFQLLGMLVEAGREVTSVSNVMTGDAGQRNMPVGTVMALIEEGMRVFTASYKRIFRSMMDEFALIARLNRKHVSPQRYQAFLDEPADPQADFDLDDMDIMPVADPGAVTSMQRMGKAQLLGELAKEGAVNPAAAVKRILEAAGIENPEELLPQPDPRQEAMARAQEELLILEIRMKDAEMDHLMAETTKTMNEAEKISVETRMAPIKARLEALKTMGAALGQDDRGRAGRMARASGDGAVSGGPAQGLRSGQGAT